MDQNWTPTEISNKVQQLTQQGSHYITSLPNVEQLWRVNSVAQNWPDAVLEGVIQMGPISERHVKVCVDILGARKAKRAEEREVRYRRETKEALANLDRLAKISASGNEAAHTRNLMQEKTGKHQHAEIMNRLEQLKKPHWSVVPAFWLGFLAALAAVAAAYFGYLTMGH